MSNKTPILKVGFILLSCAVIWFIWRFLAEFEVNDQQFGFFVSVVASIVASLIYEIIESQTIRTKQDEQLDQQERQLEEFKMTLKVLSDMQTHGILRLKKRNEYDNQFWKEFLRDAKGKLILSGKTLHKWLEFDELKEEFKNTIINKLESGCEIIFIIYEKNSLNENDKKEREYVKQFLFEHIFPKIYQNGKKVKRIKGSLVIKETPSLPYFFISNGTESLAMPYFAYKSNNENLTYGMKIDNPLSKIYYEDYSNIINISNDSEWTNEFIGKHS